MYRQILVTQKDSNLQRILWRENPEQDLKHYALRTVTYGTTSASFLATRCLAIHLELVSDLTTESFIDDLLLAGEFYTILTQIEACLNSRPLFAISNDPKDPEPLTPGHFLIGSPLTSFPDPDFSEIPENRLGRWQLLQKFIQVIWKRWSKGYLHQLQQNNKWLFPNRNLCEGDLVLICDDNTSPLFWKSGIVTHPFMGSDNLVDRVELS
ncbi:uncharacterized protein LOC142320756 [Lycorma delicatula]|uniref:uncharacterized protein LOC142320756 n=1 Tax=Lycorma delicatula TaxID=130591 RepID=UPI003F519875